MRLGLVIWREAEELPVGCIGFKAYPVSFTGSYSKLPAFEDGKAIIISYHSSLGFFVALKLVIPWRA